MSRDGAAQQTSQGPETPVPGTIELVQLRHVSAFSTKEKIRRLMWSHVQATLFRWSFHTWNRWRIMLLNRFGARIHPSCVIRRTVRIECPWNLSMGRNSCLGDRAIAYCLGSVAVGERVTISQHAHLCAGTHDYNRPDMPLIRPPIVIDDDAWVAADAFVGPGVSIGAGAILGARGCAFNDLEPWMIYGGNPAHRIKPRNRPAT